MVKSVTGKYWNLKDNIEMKALAEFMTVKNPDVESKRQFKWENYAAITQDSYVEDVVNRWGVLNLILKAVQMNKEKNARIWIAQHISQQFLR